MHDCDGKKSLSSIFLCVEFLFLVDIKYIYSIATTCSFLFLLFLSTSKSIEFLPEMDDIFKFKGTVRLDLL